MQNREKLRIVGEKCRDLHAWKEEETLYKTVSFLQSTMYIVVVSVLLQALVISKLCNIPGPARPPAVIMQLLSGPFGKYMCLRSTPSNDNKSIDIQRLKEDSQNFIKQPTPNEDWILFASGLDRLFFVLMSISMIAIHHV